MLKTNQPTEVVMLLNKETITTNKLFFLQKLKKESALNISIYLILIFFFFF